ncbi:MAG: hypothetical protein GWP17_02135, partial [Aquificales bacterium]|nr:hypothetical protein [Aquificales bacterium]
IADSGDQWEITNRLLVIPQLQVSFEDRDIIEKEDASIMRKLRLNYRGRNAYPMFRYIKPGCLMWFLEMEQIPFLTHVLEQTLDVTSRYQEDESLLYPDDVGDDEMYLLRVPSEQDGEITWTDEIRPIPQPENHIIPVDIDAEAFEALQDVVRVGNSVEIDLFMTMMPVEEGRGKRPYFPFALLIVDADSGMVLSHDVLSPLPTIDDMYSEVPQKVIDLLLGNNILPYEIYTQSPMLTAVLSPLFNDLDTPVVERPFLPMLNEAKEAMLKHLGRGFN